MPNVALFGQFRIYPRGFLGSLQAPLLVPQAKKGDLLTTSGLATIMDANESSLITANAGVEKLFDQLMRKALLISNFDFCDNIYREVFKAFGTKNFEGWYLAQFNSPAFGELHRDFLDDCLKFAMTGKRSMSLNTWDALLTTSDNKIKSSDLSEAAAMYFGRRTIRDLTPGTTNTVVELVHQWISRPGGTADLLFSAHILFGLMPH
jgi:hypothetical protein